VDPGDDYDDYDDDFEEEAWASFSDGRNGRI